MGRALLSLLVLVASGAFEAHGARRHCSDGRFVAEDGSMEVRLERGRVALASCPAVRAHTRNSRRGMSLRAVWRRCAGGVRLKARVERNCWRMTGLVRIAGVKHRFTAIRAPVCGNGVREGDEQCDGGACCDITCQLVEGCSQTCRSNSDCPQDTACQKRAGNCEGEGVCRQPPAACEGLLEPVCACDGRTYVNACEVARAGKTVRAEGECGSGQPCGTIAGITCPSGQFCEFPPGTCGVADVGGTCAVMPTACTRDFRPVCGCDGITYGNDCTRRAAGVAKKHDGACDCPPLPCDAGTRPKDTDGDGCPDSCGCVANDECGPGTFCDGQCGGVGQCVPRPGSCPPADDPVCGCDRHTYPSACHAAAAGVRIARPGKCPCVLVLCTPDTRPVDSDGDGCTDTCLAPCEEPCDCYANPRLRFPRPCLLECATCGNYWDCTNGFCDPRCGPVPPGQDECPAPAVCATNDNCLAREFCARPGCAARGTCEARPLACPAVLEPVCGCDRQTYGNACEAARSGVSVASRGPCAKLCGTIVGIPCADGEFCELPPGTCDSADLGGTCVPFPLGCPDVVRPVCGCDRTTYGNDCERRAAGVQKAHDGECGCEPLRCEPGSRPEDVDGDGCPDTCINVGCFSNAECFDRLFCSAEIGECRGKGVCRARPDKCPETWLPVCGCDGRTYGNACLAAAAGKRVSHEGDCRACVHACDCEGLPFRGECALLCPNCGSFWSCENGWCAEKCGFVPPGACKL